MNQLYPPFYQNNLEQILLRIEQELIKINKQLESNDNNNYLKKDDNLYIL